MMTKPKGNYAVHQGDEYQASVDTWTNKIILMSQDPADLENGFTAYKPGMNLYVKSVDVTDIEDAYEVSWHAEYKGMECHVAWIRDEVVQLETTYENSKRASELGFWLAEPGVLALEVPQDQLDTLFIRTMKIWGFPQ